MIISRMIRIGIVLSIFIAGCQANAVNTISAPSQAKDEVITVAAAADLQFAFTEIAHLYEEKTGKKVTLVFGSTGQLVQQIENGAPFDIIAAANIAYIDRLNESGLIIPESKALYARGRLVLAVNRASGVKATSLQDILSSQIHHVAIANPEHAPYGTAAMQALQALGLWESVQPKLAYAENVRQALRFVQTGDAEVGIVSLSVANVPEITWTLIDDALHKPLDQALAVLVHCQNPQLANDFITFINGEHGRPIMRKYGFLLPDEIQLVSGSSPGFKP